MTVSPENITNVSGNKPSQIKKIVFFPIWCLSCTIFIVGSLWRMIGLKVVSHYSHLLFDIATLGHFERILSELLNPKGGLPKPGLASYISSALINKKEHYVHFAAITWVTFALTLCWSSILYMRANNIGSWYGPLLVHFWQLGSVFPVGVNDLHYAGHFQISNNKKSHLFRSEVINFIVRYIIEPMQGFIPAFWLNHHVRIHHKEHNGPDDIQGITHFERNFKNFIWFLLDMPLQWYIRGPLVHFTNGNKMIGLEMVFSEIVFLCFGVALTKWDIYAGLLLFWIPHVTRVLCFNGLNEYMQHALVDGRWGNPDDPKYNSFLLLQPSRPPCSARGLRYGFADNFEERFHAVHHNFPHKGMIGQDAYVSKIKCHLVFDTSYVAFVGAIFKRDFNSLAEWWRPCYLADKVSDKQASDAKLSLEEKARLIESFLLPAYDLDEMGDWIKRPPFPFNMMDLGRMQRVLA